MSLAVVPALYTIYHASLGAKPFLIRKNGLTYCCVRQSVFESENALLFSFILSHFCDAFYVIKRSAYFFLFLIFYIRLAQAGTLTNKFLLKRKRYPSELGIALHNKLVLWKFASAKRKLHATMLLARHRETRVSFKSTMSKVTNLLKVLFVYSNG